ncbi:protein FAM151B [Coccinella septempunctata]|uniref:protein FAM151B n=1 Tax=Coccinella septempunctata TaxID=41139 RepID=UPI001D08B421|nr:protein FAM151B [Coccinella septempunctata]
MVLKFWVLLGLVGLKSQLKMEKNPAKTSWAHGVNDRAFLKSSLMGDVDMLEADIVMGRLTDGKENELPIMAHPPKQISDLSLMEFLTVVDDFNRDNAFKKGIKLDFKSIDAFEAAIRSEIFINITSEADYPVWLNADILEGPNAPSYTKPVDAARFLKGSKLIPNAMLSLGWTTGFNNTHNSGYTFPQIEEMLYTIKQNEVNQPITFAVRAGLVAESQDQMTLLLRNNNHTLTIWSGVQDDGFDVGKLNEILDKVEKGRIYVDVPQKLRSRLNIVNGTNNIKL